MHRQDIALLDDLLPEKTCALGEEEADNQQNDETGDEAAGCQQPLYGLFEKALHLSAASPPSPSIFTGTKPCSRTDCCPAGERAYDMKELTACSLVAS